MFAKKLVINYFKLFCQVMSENISSAIALNGETVMKQPLIKSMRVVKKETLKLIPDWVSRSNDHQMVSLFFLAPLECSEFYLIKNKFKSGLGKFHPTVARRGTVGLSKDERSLRPGA